MHNSLGQSSTLGRGMIKYSNIGIQHPVYRYNLLILAVFQCFYHRIFLSPARERGKKSTKNCRQQSAEFKFIHLDQGWPILHRLRNDRISSNLKYMKKIFHLNFPGWCGVLSALPGGGQWVPVCVSAVHTQLITQTQYHSSPCPLPLTQHQLTNLG